MQRKRNLIPLVGRGQAAKLSTPLLPLFSAVNCAKAQMHSTSITRMKPLVPVIRRSLLHPTTVSAEMQGGAL